MVIAPWLLYLVDNQRRSAQSLTPGLVQEYLFQKLDKLNLLWCIGPWRLN